MLLLNMCWQLAVYMLVTLKVPKLTLSLSGLHEFFGILTTALYTSRLI